MSLSRVAAGAGTALLVVGAVVVFKPSSRLSAESFVSAAFTNEGGVSVVGNGDEINKLPVCKALTARMNTFDGVFKDNGGTAVAVDTAEANRMTADWLADGTGANANWIYVEEKPCICGKFAATTGRVCEATGNANPKGQSYRPRCDLREIPAAYTAGCWCGADDVFTSANLNLAVGPGTKLGVKDTDGIVTADAQQCGTNYCIKGEKCAHGTNACTDAAGANPTTRTKQTYALAIPMIEGYDDKKIKVCTSTALQKKKCVVTVATAQTPNVPECKDA